MESKVKLAGHPVHQMLIVFPLGLLATAVVFDVIFLIANNSDWTKAAYYMIGAGVVTGLAAAVPGTVDFLAIPRGTRAWRIGLVHGLGNLVVVTLFALSWYMRRENPAAPPTEAVVAGMIGAGLAVFTGWLGGELVDRLGVGVDDGAHLNAPSSLTGAPAKGIVGADGRHGWVGQERRLEVRSGFAGPERRRSSI